MSVYRICEKGIAGLDPNGLVLRWLDRIPGTGAASAVAVGTHRVVGVVACRACARRHPAAPARRASSERGPVQDESGKRDFPPGRLFGKFKGYAVGIGAGAKKEPSTKPSRKSHSVDLARSVLDEASAECFD